ncbi:sugar phosphate isomerase/epimerase family protein [Natrononativus amylolyticus]|uniref:sugar phosphate isomerase/epimerase family protein n=1 Tax=Natrononativus amylolyticus TaxID=2963434 RepID=UPI0020CD03D0|nr:TIM barrel protein [Natrononativus amylolyticus]
MVRTAIQLYTLRAFEEPTAEVISRVGETTFDGVEFYAAHFDDFEDDGDLERTADALDDAGLGVAGAHLGVDRIESSLEDVVAACETVGISRLIVPTYDPGAFESAAGVEAAADRLAALADDLADHDVELLYHNHTFEFTEIEVDGDAVPAFEHFVEHADGRFGYEPDVGLATHAGYDALELLSLVSERAPVVHVTDTVPDDPDALHADVGTGVVDLEACVDAARENGAEWLVCENGVTDDAAGALAHGSDAFADYRARSVDQPANR